MGHKMIPILQHYSFDLCLDDYIDIGKHWIWIEFERFDVECEAP